MVRALSKLCNVLFFASKRLFLIFILFFAPNLRAFFFVILFFSN